MEQLEQFKEKIDDKEDELQQVSAQLEISKRQKLNIEMQMESVVKQLEEEREELQVSDVLYFCGDELTAQVSDSQV